MIFKSNDYDFIFYWRFMKEGKSRYDLIIIVLKSMFIDNCVIEIWE